MSRLLISAWLHGISIGALVTVLATLGLTENETGAEPPRSMLDANTNYTWLPPMTVELHILTPEEFAEKRNHPSVTGWSRLGTSRNRCRIYVPTDMGMIYRTPWRPELHQDHPAVWSNESAPALLAHELMHCMIGAWHP